MEFSTTSIKDVLLLTPRVFEDDRGFFLESFRKSEFMEAGISYEFVQDNHSCSSRGVLRGLHYQIQQPQGKLVRAVTGEIFDVAVDLRRSSPTFGMWYGSILSSENKQQLWLPPGIAHGFLVLSQTADVLYKATDYYAPVWERCLLWNDPQVNIIWPEILHREPIISPKDQHGRRLSDAELFE
jgi:dTDP-4-dehydrorhamnose 3,5-epimerase